MRVVYDTMLFFQVAAQQPPRLHGSFQAIDAGRVQLCMSRELLEEVADVLSRPEFLDKAPHFTPELAMQFFAKLRSASTWFEPVPNVFTLAEHPKDDHLFNLAIAARVDRLVTWESRLLRLQDQSSADVQRLRSLAPQLRIVTPKELLSELKS
jgi:putative PIN family toxin of toxin-antitoxin system